MSRKLTPEELDTARRTDPERWREIVRQRANRKQANPNAALQAVGTLTKDALAELRRRGLP